MSGFICLPNVDKNCRRTSTKTKGIELGPFHPTEEQWRSIFSRFDCDRDGRLSKEELKQAFHSLGSRAPGFRALAALHHADKNGDGYIKDEELEALVQYAAKLGYKIK